MPVATEYIYVKNKSDPDSSDQNDASECLLISEKTAFPRWFFSKWEIM